MKRVYPRATKSRVNPLKKATKELMQKQLTSTLLRATLVSLVFGLPAAPLLAHGEKSHEGASKASAPISPDEHAHGRQGDPKKVTRTVTLDMHDTMRFTPADITVKQGETLRFVVRNKGGMLHEMVIGTLDELKMHGAMMKKHPGMEHDEPYMAHVSAGKKEEMVWQFTQPGAFYFACLLPGHFEAGMIGKINVLNVKATKG